MQIPQITCVEMLSHLVSSLQLKKLRINPYVSTKHEIGWSHPKKQGHDPSDPTLSLYKTHAKIPHQHILKFTKSQESYCRMSH